MLPSLIPFMVLMVRVQSAAVSLNGRTGHEASAKSPLVRRASYKNQTTNGSLSPRSDFEPVDIDGNLQVIFRIAQFLGANNVDYNEQTVKNNLNRDFWWYALPDKMMSDKEREQEENVSKYMQANYEGLLAVAEGTRPWLDEEGKQPQYWLGEVGMMSFLKTREPPREFVWTLDRNDADKHPIRKCYVNVNHDPYAHSDLVYVWLDGDEPRVEFDSYAQNDRDRENDKHSREGDAVIVFCDKAA